MNRVYFASIGFNTNSTWVDYYNSILSTTHNKDVILKNTYNDIKTNYLVDNPLKTKIVIVKTVMVLVKNSKQ